MMENHRKGLKGGDGGGRRQEGEGKAAAAEWEVSYN